MYTILGSGFGLYGYLPALVRELNLEVALPQAYRAKLIARPELRDCEERVTWKDTRDACLDAASKAVVCLPPRVQAEISDELAARGNIRTVVLEKPVAPTPQTAMHTQQRLTAAGKLVVVDYIFLYLDWYDELRTLLTECSADVSVSITWFFRAHHFQHGLTNWKAASDEGGGVVRFYGIHLLAALASLGYVEAVESQVESSRGAPAAVWRAVFCKPGSARVDVLVDTNAEAAQFSFGPTPPHRNLPEVRLRDPFDDAAFVARWPGEDRRIKPLARMLQATAESDVAPHALYEQVNALWLAVESGTRYRS